MQTKSQSTLKASRRTNKVLSSSGGSALVVEDMGHLVEVAGHGKKLYVLGFKSRCGTIDGVAFAFEDDGAWCMSLRSLREIVRRAEHERGIVPNAQDDRRLDSRKENTHAKES